MFEQAYFSFFQDTPLPIPALASLLRAECRYWRIIDPPYGLLRYGLFSENFRTNSTNLPDGQITSKSVNPLLQKYSDLQKTQNRSIFPTIPSHQKGRYAIVTFAGRAAVDAEGATDERA